MQLTGLTFDINQKNLSLISAKDFLISQVKNALDKSDIVILPELFSFFLWNYTEHLSSMDEKLKFIESEFKNEIIPQLQIYTTKDKLIVLGTIPHTKNNIIYNSAPIITQNKIFYQDKIQLTPWEYCFQGGNTIHIFEFLGLKCAVLICLDIEMPEYSVLLKKENIDIVFCPSATTDILGSERVQRCASARSIELGCATVVVPLIGGLSNCDLIDFNMGRISCYYPSQSEYKTHHNIQTSEIYSDGTRQKQFKVDGNILKKIKEKGTETKPFQYSPKASIEQMEI